MNGIIKDLLAGNNNPQTEEKAEFISSDHIRYQNGHDVSGHNYDCHRLLVIEKNIERREGYTATMFNLYGIHPRWGNNIQMAPKQMRIEKVSDNTIELRGFGFDEKAIFMGAPPAMASYADYGIIIKISDGEIYEATLNMYDRNISIVYLK